ARPVRTVDLGQPQPPAEHRLDVALAARQRARFLHVPRNAWIAGEVSLDVVLRGVALDAEVGGESERAHAVDQTEVDHLRVAALLRADLGRRDAEDLAGSRAV